MGEIINTYPSNNNMQFNLSKLQYTHQKIERVRTAKGITATHMTKNLGYTSVAAYRKIELGQVKIPIPLGVKIAELLGEDFIELFFE